MDHDRQVDELITAWEKLLGPILKLLGRHGITVPIPSERVVPEITQAAIQRALAILSAGHRYAGQRGTLAIITKWLAIGALLEDGYDDPAAWRLSASLLLTLEVEDRIEEVNSALDLRDRLN